MSSPENPEPSAEPVPPAEDTDQPTEPGPSVRSSHIEPLTYYNEKPFYLE